MTEDQDGKDSQSDSGSKTFINKSKDKKSKIQRPLTKIILRRLPPTMTEESFLEQVSPIPEHDYFYFAKADPTLGNNLFSRAYINFVNVEDIFLFRDKFDGYVFLDEKGGEFVGIVEYAPFQRVSKKKKKKDPKCGTLESDPIYQEFIETLNKDPETENQPKLEYSYPLNDATDKKSQTTPLLEYLAARKQDKRVRDDRRRRENDKRKMRIERKTKDGPIKEEEGDAEVKKIKTRESERDKKDTEDQIRSDDGIIFESKSYKDRKLALKLDKTKKKPENDRIGRDDEFEDKREKLKTPESPREQKSKKYSDTRKERIKQSETLKTEKQNAISKLISSDPKNTTLNNDIKPFTQLPQVKTDDLSTIMDSFEKKVKIDSKDKPARSTKEFDTLVRRNSLDSNKTGSNDESDCKKYMEERQISSEREGSEEKEKCDGSERRSERRIRNKDRPSLVIYQPGMGKFSKQRLAKEKDPTPAKAVSDSEKKDT